jgi:apolipoprotein N-acyltransferase
MRLPLLAGVLLGTSYLPWPLLALNLGAFVPLLRWLDAHEGAPALSRLKAGLVFGWTTQLIALHFMYSMLEQSWLAALLYLGMSLAIGLRITLSIVVLGWLRRRTRLPWSLLLPAVWISFEWVQGRVPDLRMTGEHLAHTVAGYPFLVQFADLVGPYGVTAALLAINGLIYEVLDGWGTAGARRAAVALAVLAGAVLAYDAWAWRREDPAGRTLRVAFIQPNVSLRDKHDSATNAEQWSTLVELSTRAAGEGAELIVWPETARPEPLFHRPDRPASYAMADVSELARTLGVTLLVGVEYAVVRDREDFDLYNAAIVVDAAGRLEPTWAAKAYLVPFVEATPFRSLFGSLVEGRGGEWRWLAGGFRPGPMDAILPAAGARVGVLVCYEQLFPDRAARLRRAGAELQAVITNDAWFGRSLFQPYQANAARLRAIENRTPIVRVANTGISGFIDRRGRYDARTELFEEAVAVRDVPLAGPPSVYSRSGDVVVWLALIGLAAAVAASGRFSAAS